MTVIHRYASPLGTLTAAESGGAVTALVMEGQKYAAEHIPADAAEGETDLLRALGRWLDAYFAGEAPDSAALPLAPEGTAFQRRVWRRLRAIPYGTVCTYGSLARELATSPRAVGGAVGRNPVSLLIPCHRVVGSGGALTGYAGGVRRKAALLRLEGAPAGITGHSSIVEDQA